MLVVVRVCHVETLKGAMWNQTIVFDRFFWEEWI